MACARVISFTKLQPTVNFAYRYPVLQLNFTKIRIPIKSRRYGFNDWTLKGENTGTSLDVKYYEG